jgi:starch-binding outer membrane protein, SusD/RagB family
MKSKSLLYSLSILILFLSSCKKQLEHLPTDTIDATKAFTNVADLQKGLFAVYAQNSDGNRIYIAAILADETKISNENRGQGQFTFKWQYSATDGEQNAAFAQYYNMIDQLHRILAVIDNIPGNNSDEESQKQRIKSELITLRGIAYYELLINFMPPGYDPNAAGVPVVLKSDLFGQPARNTVGEVVAQIESDLAVGRAEALIPAAPSDEDVVRLNQSAIAAYQARVALLKQDWDAAANFATESINLSGKSLANQQEFPDYWLDNNEAETIWKYRNNAEPQLYWRDVNGDVFFEPSDKLKDQFDRDNDVRFAAYFTIDPTSQDTALITKYPGSSIGPQINDLKLVRIAELYLIRAEAKAELNDLVSAANDINTLRASRITNYVNVSFSSTAQAVDAIINERFKELCYEGFRFFDLKRRGLPVQRLVSDVQSTTWQTLPATDYRFALPIPQHEMFANPNMVQNPGY